MPRIRLLKPWTHLGPAWEMVMLHSTATGAFASWRQWNEYVLKFRSQASSLSRVKEKKYLKDMKRSKELHTWPTWPTDLPGLCTGIPQGSACVGKSTINIMEAEFYQAGLSNQFSHIRICESSHVICFASVFVLLPGCSRYHRLNAPESKWHPSRSWPRCHSIVIAFSKRYYQIPQTQCQELWSEKIANSISIFRVCEVPEIAGANKDAAFDGSTASAYLMEAWRAIPKGLHDGIILIIPEAASQHS